MPKHIGILRLSALGDVILLVPTIRTLQAQYPQAKITWITTKACYSLLQGLSGVEFVVIDKPHSLTSYWQVKKQLAKYSFDVLLAMQASFRANLLYPLIKADVKIGFDHKRAKDLHHLFVSKTINQGRDHLLDGFLRFADALDCHNRIIRWDLPITQDDYNWAEKILPANKILVINPSASKPERNWFVERYCEVIEQAKKRWDVSIILSGGPAADEQQCAANIETKVKFPVLNLVGKTTTKQMAALLSKADVLLAPDTGPVHLATAMGTPVVGLYAVAPPELSGPYLSQQLVVDQYPQAVSKILNRDPQTIPWGTRVHTQQAMALITVDQVMEKLAKVFESQTKPIAS